MARILVTGMTSPQASRRLSERSTSFTGALVNVLESCGHEVDWLSPSVRFTSSDAKRYDSVLIGVAPPLSVTANYAYGALSMIGQMSDSKKTSLVLDTTEWGSITANLRAIAQDFSYFLRPFYSARKSYKEVVTDGQAKSSVKNGVEFLAYAPWLTTLVPAMPWSTADQVTKKIPQAVESSVALIEIDSCYVKRTPPRIDDTREHRWVIDTDKTKWCRSVTATLAAPHSLMKTKRSSTDSEVIENISRSIGALISPSNDGQLHWSPRWVQAMNTSTPVLSDWRTTVEIGQSWTHLPAGVEEMSHIDRYELSVIQKQEYSASLPEQDKVKKAINDALRIK